MWLSNVTSGVMGKLDKRREDEWTVVVTPGLVSSNSTHHSPECEKEGCVGEQTKTKVYTVRINNHAQKEVADRSYGKLGRSHQWCGCAERDFGPYRME